jgi:hypothetical protein
MRPWSYSARLKHSDQEPQRSSASDPAAIDSVRCCSRSWQPRLGRRRTMSARSFSWLLPSRQSACSGCAREQRAWPANGASSLCCSGPSRCGRRDREPASPTTTCGHIPEPAHSAPSWSETAEEPKRSAPVPHQTQPRDRCGGENAQGAEGAQERLMRRPAPTAHSTSVHRVP